MKKFLTCVFAVVVMFGMYCDYVWAGTVTVTYFEPTTNAAGNSLTNLKETTIYWKQDSGLEQKIIVPAQLATGGMTISKTITVADPPLCGSSTVSVQVTASNTNTTNFESIRTPVVSAVKTVNDPNCKIINSPSGLTVTFE